MYKRKYNKKVINAKQVTADGINFKSRLEKFTYLMLKSNNIKCDYEKITFVLQDTFKSGCSVYQKGTEKGQKKFKKKQKTIRSMTYTPDFVNKDWGIEKKWIIEVKGFETDSYKIKKKIFLKQLNDINANILYLLPSNKKEVLESIEWTKKI
jgi:hypothetical protein